MAFDKRIETFVNSMFSPAVQEALVALDVVAEGIVEYTRKGDDLIIRAAGKEGAGEEEVPAEEASAEEKQAAMRRVDEKVPMESRVWLAKHRHTTLEAVEKDLIKDEIQSGRMGRS